MRDHSKLTILIPTINETTLPQVVAEVCQQAPDAEIVILGFGEAEKVADKFHTKYIDLGKKTLKSISQNIGIESTKNEWLIVLDADAVPLDGWADAMYDCFEQGFNLFSGAVDISVGNYWMKVYNLSLLHEFLVGKPPSFRKHIPGISIGFTRTFYQQNGKMDNQRIRSDDYDWSLRATEMGNPPYFCPDAKILHLPVDKDTFSGVSEYWIRTGGDNLKVRLLHRDILKTPFFMRSRWFILLASPVLALIPTFRIFLTSPKELLTQLHLLPGIYLTKLLWCYGAFKVRS